MTTKHTPGPWHADCYLAVKTQHGTCIAQTFTKYTTLNEAPHNARLIAAAPDLLDALERLLRAVSVGFEDRDAGNEDMAVDQARAALAKARGEG